MTTIRRGHLGPEVSRWQAIVGVRATGDFDENTEAATMQWQAQHGVEPDGVVGPRTWGAAGVADSVTPDIDDAFFPKLRLMAMSLNARASDLLCVFYSESQCKATAHNDNPKTLPPEERYNASGIFQAMPRTLVGLGWTDGHAAFRALTATEQLVWAERYYRPYRGLLRSVGAIYTATFLPALVSHAADRNYVLTAEKGQLPWAYWPNASFDANGDRRITVGELEEAVIRNCVGPRWEELRGRLCAGDDTPTQPEMPAVRPPSGADMPTLHADPLAYLKPETD